MKISEAGIMIKRYSLLILLIILSGTGAFSQEKKFSLSVSDILFKDLIDTIEKQVPVKIYYSDKWVDSLFLDVNSENAGFEEILKSTLGKEGFTFIVSEGKKVILSKGYSVKTDFKQEYLDLIRKNSVETDTTRYTGPAVRVEESNISEEYRLFRIGDPRYAKKNGMAVLSGTIINPNDGQFVNGAVVYVDKLKTGVMTNNSGYYSLSLPRGQYQVSFSMIGMKPTRRNVVIFSDGILDVEMTEDLKQMATVVVMGERNNSVRDVRTGIEKIYMKMLKQIPLGLGEVDVIKSSLLLPGVQTAGEASSGYNVRGGSADQNLIFLNNAPVLNSSHFFGFFSAFNSDLISDVTLYKSGMPARYGGRLSSVMDITAATGDKKKVKVSGGISPVTGRIMVEGPIRNQKSSFILGARTTYSDWLLGQLDNSKLNKSSAGFYDIQGVISSEVNAKNSVSFSGYFSNDNFEYFRECSYNYGNVAFTLKWAHAFSQRLSVQSYAILSNYRYEIATINDSTQFNTMNYSVSQKILRTDFTFFPTEKHRTEFGVDASLYNLNPGVRTPFGDYSSVTSKTLEPERAAEPSVYLSDEFQITPLFSVSAGVRATLYTSFGPKTVFTYYDGVTKSPETIADTLYYNRGENTALYPGIDYRFSSRMILTQNLSLKLGLQRVYQYLHMISNTTSISPTDIWKLSDTYIKPERSDQVSLGLYHTYGRKAISTSLEGYYKRLDNILDYKGGATLLMNEHLETEVLSGTGKAYGVEFMIRKQAGDISGWISYTYSRILLKVDGDYESEKVNDGNYFPASYDKPHDFKMVVNAKLSRRLNFTSNLVYNTGRPVTYPVAFYQFNNSTQVYYSGRNEYRVPDYMRLDMAATLNGNLRAKKLNHSSFTLTVYNVLGRQNPYSLFFRIEDGKVKGYQMTIINRPVVMLSYNFRILGNAAGDF